MLAKLIAGSDAHYSNAYCVNHAKGLSAAVLQEFNAIFVSVSAQDPALFQPHGTPFAGGLATAAKRDDVVYVCGLSETVCAYLANQFFESEPMTIIWAHDYRFIRKFRERATPVGAGT